MPGRDRVSRRGGCRGVERRGSRGGRDVSGRGEAGMGMDEVRE